MRSRGVAGGGSCERALLTLLALHLPLLLVTWLVAGVAPWVPWVPLVGGAGVAVALAVGWWAPRHRVRALVVRGGLVLAAAAVVATTGGWSLARLPYLTVVAAVLLFNRSWFRRRNVAAEEEMTARIDELSQTKDQLLALASHEFRTPITGVMGFARTLEAHARDLDENTLRAFAGAIEDHSRRLSRLVDNLVATARKPELELDAVCDIRAVVSSVLADLDLPTDGGTRIQMSLRGKLRAGITGDAAHRILLNLLDNAVKFADPGTLVRLDARHQGGDVIVDVENVGPPIPADLRENLYDPFVQGDSSDTRKAEGLGLGLHVVRRLVEAYGGRVELHDSNGLVVFRVRLRPVTVSADRPPTPASASA